jgi:long-chain acyl-CoA synthetase
MLHSRVHARQTPEKPAYIMGKSGEIITYGQLEARANQCSHFFREIGLKPKDHICVLMENNVEFLQIISAAQVAGLYYSTISRYLKSSEIEYIINDSESRVVITSAAMEDAVKGLPPRCPKVRHWLMVGGEIEGFTAVDKAIAKFPKTPIPEGVEGRDMLYSSGTTGRPKGVVSTVEDMPFGEIHPSAMVIINLYNINDKTVYLSPAPLYHAAPLRFCMLTLRMGGTVVLMEKYDSLEALALIEKYRVTHSQWVPTMFVRMLKLPDQDRLKYDLSSHQIAIHAAAPCPVEVKEKMIDWWGPILFEYYGGTEGNSFIAVSSREWLTHKGSVGKCYVGKIHILDDEENELPPGVSGSVFIEDGNTFEYHNDAQKTAESRTSKGWNTLGDVGYIDEEGYLYLTDRKANMIISGGVNIYPQETENVLTLHPKVMDAAVFGIPHEEFGEEVKAVVQPASMAEAGSELEKELLAYCNQHLSKIKCPKSIDFVSDFPRTPTGKLLKRLLRDNYTTQK